MTQFVLNKYFYRNINEFYDYYFINILLLLYILTSLLLLGYIYL